MESKVGVTEHCKYQVRIEVQKVPLLEEADGVECWFQSTVPSSATMPGPTVYKWGP